MARGCGKRGLRRGREACRGDGRVARTAYGDGAARRGVCERSEGLECDVNFPFPKGNGDSDGVSYPVAVGATAAAHGIDLEAALAAYLHAFISNLVQAAVRLVPLGQRDGVATMAEMEAVMLEVAERAAQSSLDDLGSATFLSDIMSMKHEVQYSRVFRS